VLDLAFSLILNFSRQEIGGSSGGGTEESRVTKAIVLEASFDQWSEEYPSKWVFGYLEKGKAMESKKLFRSLCNYQGKSQ
jgi:hypothetical protein